MHTIARTQKRLCCKNSEAYHSQKAHHPLRSVGGFTAYNVRNRLPASLGEHRGSFAVLCTWMADAIRLDPIFRFDQRRSDSTDPIRPAFQAPGAQLVEVSRNSMLPDAFSRPRKMHLDERGILKAAPRRSMLPEAPKNASRQAVDPQGSS